MESNLREQIIKIMKEKSSVKQDIFQETLNAFRTLKDVARAEAENLKREAFNIDKRVTIEFRDRSDFMFELKVAGDLLVFQMHTNIFEFDNAHYIKKHLM